MNRQQPDRFFGRVITAINLKPLRAFLRSGSAGGVILFACVLLSLLIANTPLHLSFAKTLTYPAGFENTVVQLRFPLLSWINDGLMAVFFLMVGLEIKRAVLEGELSTFRQALLPVLAAIGGAVVPALIYLLCNQGKPSVAGWGIPMATDIAFALAVLSLLGKRVPVSLKLFLAALAIVDDLIAILVIAVFYTSELHLTWLLYAFVCWLLLLVFNKTGVKRLYCYIIPGLFIWYCVHHSGVHATIAGVLVALTLPTTPDEKESPLEKLEHLLIKPVNYIIMPLFALANTNICFEPGMTDGLQTSMGAGIILGLLLGKPLGIVLTSRLAVQSGICSLPDKVGWRHVLGLGMLGGIGFTMSVFIALLSFSGQEDVLPEAKFAILTASLLSGLVGFLWLRYTGKARLQSRLS